MATLLLRLIAMSGAALVAGGLTTVEASQGRASREDSAAARQSSAVLVMGLHASPETQQPMGSVTSRVLSQAPGLVVAWPPSLTVNRDPFGPPALMRLAERR